MTKYTIPVRHAQTSDPRATVLPGRAIPISSAQATHRAAMAGHSGLTSAPKADGSERQVPGGKLVYPNVTAGYHGSPDGSRHRT